MIVGSKSDLGTIE